MSNLAASWRNIPERYNLIGSRCDTCKTNYFPSRVVCNKCRRKGRIVDAKFSGKGKVYSFTVVSSPPQGFELETPYILAIIELAEGPKLTSQVVDCAPKDARIGLPVKLVFRKIQEDGAEGLIHYGFKFEPDKQV